MTSRPLRSLIVALALTLPAMLGSAASSGASPDCTPVERDGIGLSCQRGDGLFEVFAPDGVTSLGFTHGPDPAPTAFELAGARNVAARPVQCVGGGAGSYFVQVIYARAHDAADRYSSKLATIRSLIEQANGLIGDAGTRSGTPVDLQVKCAGGEIEVLNKALPTNRAAANFNTIVNDLKAMGYADGRVKYWVYYDDTGACSCGGMGHIYPDDSDDVGNLNNGNGVPMFAVDFGYDSARILMHELGHNLGAVQDSSPHSTQAGHCYDGRDTMCYNDGGPKGSLYSTSSCGTEVFDCGNDDYFDANPPAGSYLDTHWQVGSRLSRYLQFGPDVAPTMVTWSCPASAYPGAALNCNVRADDGDSARLDFTIEWGDGATTTFNDVEATTHQVAHTYAAGSYTARAWAADAGGLTTSTLSDDLVVENRAPVISQFRCDDGQPGDAVACTLSVSDDGPSYTATIAWGDAQDEVLGPFAPGASAFSHTFASAGDYAPSVSVVDDGSPGQSAGPVVTSVGIHADTAAPSMVLAHPRADTAYIDGCSRQVNRMSEGLFVQRGCVSVYVTDETGVDRVEVRLDGEVVASSSHGAGQYTFEFDTPGLRQRATVAVSAFDTLGYGVTTIRLVKTV